MMLMILRVLLGLCLFAYSAYAGACVWAARQWHRVRQVIDPDWTPPVTILKPVRGNDAYAYDNFASFCRLDYPTNRVQIVFGVLDANDPAIRVVRQLQCDFPDRDITIIVPPPAPLRGHNLKVCNLVAMLPAAKHSLLVLCDSDIRVGPDYLRHVVAPFREEERKGEKEKRRRGEEGKIRDTRYEIREGEDSSLILHPSSFAVGLVTCPYRGFLPQNLPSYLEALGFGADFIPSALVSRALSGIDFAFGATIAIPRVILDEIGGFEAILDDLADDFLLGNRVKHAGYQVVLSNYVVENVLGAEPFDTMWARRLRWARTVRACRPIGYLGAFITQGSTLALLFGMAMGFNAPGISIMFGVLAVRIAAATWIANVYTHDVSVRRGWLLLPLSDLLQSALYVVSFFGSNIVWRGQKFRLLTGGKIIRIP